ncbi:MAG: aldehyde dehydrogenase family protein [Pseudonocardiaceae bacterium]|nr:aldehyde dehydrogenase family protein [Pseudonocardiaceae bacterium]
MPVFTEADNASRAAELLDHEWHLLAGGRLLRARSGRTYPDVSPYTEKVIAEVPDADSDDVAAAVRAARDAASGWGRTPAPQRARIVEELAGAIEQRARDFAVLDAVDGGAPISEMIGDVAAAVASLRLFAGLGLELKGATIPASENLHFTVREPFGVAARIVPFNHPFMFAAGKIAAPLVAGNATVLKPPEAAPLSALLLGEVAREILPPGVLSILVGDGPAVPRAIVRDPAVRRIGFIGSEPTGRAIQRDAADAGVKAVTLELGGKNALIALPDADPGEVARGAVEGMNFTWSGQSCGSTSRLLVHESIADEVVAQVVGLVEARRMGSPLDPRSEQGTVISRQHYDKVMGHLETARDEGAEVLTGGARPDDPGTGLFIAPTVLGNVAADSRIARVEVFGPVLSVIRWGDGDDVVAMANAVSYGLTASVWTDDLRTAHRMAAELEAGYVWINGSARHFPGVPFGGVKNSGIGREESLEELLSYTTLKAVNVVLGSPKGA